MRACSHSVRRAFGKNERGARSLSRQRQASRRCATGRRRCRASAIRSFSAHQIVRVSWKRIRCYVRQRRRHRVYRRAPGGAFKSARERGRPQQGRYPIATACVGPEGHPAHAASNEPEMTTTLQRHSPMRKMDDTPHRRFDSALLTAFTRLQRARLCTEE
jgi:hypothetical protein